MDLLCGQCGRTLSVDDALAGNQTRCQYCGGIVNVPNPEAEGAAVALTRLSDEEGDFADEFITKAKLSLRKKMLVICGSCSERLTVEQRLAGKLAQCPNCGQQIRIPAEVGEEELEQARRSAETQGLAETLDLGPDLEAATPAPAADIPRARPAEEEPAPELEFPRPSTIRPWRRRRRGVPAFAWCVGIVLLGLVGLIVGRYVWQERQARRNRPGFVAVSPTTLGPPATTGPLVAPAPQPEPEPPVLPLLEPGPLVRNPEPEPLPGPDPAELPSPAGSPVSVQAAKMQLVSGSGLLPAPAGNAYLLVRASIKASVAELTIETAGAVVVETPKGRFSTLGVPGGDGLLTAPARQATLKIPPAASRMETFVFLVPEETRGGRLKIADVGEADLPAVASPSEGDNKALPGKYAEARRFLRVAFDDPVMDRLRQAPRHEVIVRADGDSAELSLSPTDLLGKVKPVSESVWQGTLSAGGESIPCQLRLASGGKHLILYLAREPFHQVVYERQ